MPSNIISVDISFFKIIHSTEEPATVISYLQDSISFLHETLHFKKIFPKSSFISCKVIIMLFCVQVNGTFFSFLPRLINAPTGSTLSLRGQFSNRGGFRRGRLSGRSSRNDLRSYRPKLTSFNTRGYRRRGGPLRWVNLSDHFGNKSSWISDITIFNAYPMKYFYSIVLFDKFLNHWMKNITNVRLKLVSRNNI